MNQSLKLYIPIVEFLGKALGDNHEVVLHDFTNPEHAVVAIANGNLSGRQVGSPMTNVAMKMLQEDVRNLGQSRDCLLQHNAIGKGGDSFKSSTMLIRDEYGKAKGALCVNFFTEPLKQILNFLEGMGISSTNNYLNDQAGKIFEGEVLADTGNSALDSVFYIVMNKRVNMDCSSPSVRQEIINEFYTDGGFLLKGSVSYIADKLDMSEPSVYRYLTKAKQENMLTEDDDNLE